MNIDDIPIQPDRPKRYDLRQNIGIAISVIALIVSGLSLRQSRESSIIQRELARPYLEITKAETDMIHYSDPKERGLAVTVDVKNLGHLTAAMTSYTLRPGTVDMEGTPDAALICDQGMALQPQRAGDMSFELPDGHTKTVFISFNVPKECPNQLRGFVGKLTFVYQDSTHSKSYAQELIFTAPLKN
jgi:hypothetical protein